MGRARVRRIFPVLLSLSAAATAMSLPLTYIKRAVQSGELIAREGPNHRILCAVADLTTWWAAHHPRIVKRNAP